MRTRHTALIAGAMAAFVAAACGGAHQVEEGTSADEAPMDSGGDSQSQRTTTETSTTGAAGGEAPPPQVGEPEPMVTASEEWNALLDADADLRSSIELSERDCSAAGEHIARLCELAERICEIAEDTGDAGAGDRCTDGTARCERGRSAYEDACD